ncbi:MAG: GNAT family N-acetyltransferase [Lachnospiraceae bacterium]|nr:GNAT family N-acetyltransferase [Lachnospiraceae bacterium]
MIREANKDDLNNLLHLYLHLHEKELPQYSQHLIETWDTILNDKNHHIVLNIVDGILVSSCVCVIIPNLTRGIRPYAFIENVVTHEKYRGKGYATECLNYAREIAKENNCYKMMLLTGSQKQNTLDFYSRAGYNNTDKTAFIQWLE